MPSTGNSIMLKLYADEFRYQSEVARILGMKPPAISKAFKRLTKQGMIKEIPKLFPKQYKLTNRGVAHCCLLLELVESEKNSRNSNNSNNSKTNNSNKNNSNNSNKTKSPTHLRAHNIILIADIIQQPKKWTLASNAFHKLSDVAVMTNWTTQIQARYRGIYFMISPSSITFKPKEIYDTDPDNAIFKALEVFRELINILKETNKGLKTRASGGTVRIASFDIALEGDKLAKQVINKGEKIITTRFTIDESKGKGRHEIEFTHKTLSRDDTRNYEEFVNGVISNDINIESLKTPHHEKVAQCLIRLEERTRPKKQEQQKPPEPIGRIAVRIANQMWEAKHGQRG